MTESSCDFEGHVHAQVADSCLVISVCGEEWLAVLGGGSEREGAEGQVLCSQFCLEQEDEEVHEMRSL